MICFEQRPIYNMKGCSHTICTLCAEQMKGMPSSMAYPLSNVFTVKDQGVVCLRCPYCRMREPVNFKQIITGTDAYKMWLELELKYDGEKSNVTIMYNDYYHGKNRPYTITWTVYASQPQVSKYEFVMNNSPKHQKHLDGNPLRKQKHVSSFKKTGNVHRR